MSQLVSMAEKNPHRIAVEKRFWSADFLRAFLQRCDDLFFRVPDKAIAIASAVLEAAREVGDPHILTKALALTGSAYRMCSSYSKAHEFLKEARTQAGDCDDCLCEVLRRTGICLDEQGKQKEAEQALLQSIEHFDAIGDQDGIGRVLVSLGIVSKKLGKLDEALAHESRALRLLSTDSPAVYHLAAAVNIGWILVDGNHEHFSQAEGYLSDFEKRLKGEHVPTLLRLKLRWLHGMILARNGARRQAIEKLRNVRDAFLRERQDEHAIAVTADLAHVYLQTLRFNSIADVVRACISTLGEAANAYPLLQSLLYSANREVPEKARNCIQALRDAVAPDIPCLVREAATPNCMTI